MKGIEIKVVKTLKTKKVYNVFLNGKDTKFIAQEVFTNGETKRYPFYEKDGKIVEKYNSIKFGDFSFDQMCVAYSNICKNVVAVNTSDIGSASIDWKKFILPAAGIASVLFFTMG